MKFKFPSESEYEVMQIINASRSPMHGLAIVNASEGSIVRTGVYQFLSRLVEKNLIKFEGSAEHSSNVKLYSLTKYGAALCTFCEALNA